MPITAYRPESLRYQLFRGSEAVDALMLTPDQLRSQAWIRLGQDVYADSRLERDHELMCRAVALRLPPGAAIAGPSAAYLLGVPHAASFNDPVHVVVPNGTWHRSRTSVRVHRVDLLPGDVEGGHGLPRTSPARTVWDVASLLEPIRAVPIIDALVGLGVIDEDALDAYLLGRKGQRGHRRVVRAVGLTDGRAQSPPESVLRVRLILEGLPRPVAQCVVPVGGFVLHPDLGWPEYRVAIEYDGHWHADQLDLDRRRLNLLVSAGWMVLHVTNDRLRRDFRGLLGEVRTALRSRGWPG